MNTSQAEARDRELAQTRASLTGSHRRTLEAIFRHPSAHNLEWSDVIALFNKIGTADPKGSGAFSLAVDGKRHLMRKPHTKDLTSSEVIELRQFLRMAHWSDADSSEAPAHPDPAAPNLLIVLGHHDAKIYRIEDEADTATAQEIIHYDPHHLLHHQTHKDRAREAIYERIDQAAAMGGRIVVVGYGTGKSDAAHHLSDYLRSRHAKTYQRIVHEITADLSRTTMPQLLEIAREALR